MKPALDAPGDAVADALGKSHQALVTSGDADVPMFVPADRQSILARRVLALTP